MHQPSNPVRFNTQRFYADLDTARHQRGLSWREVGIAADVSNSTFSRIGKNRKDPNATNLAKLLHWLGETDLGPYITRREEANDVH